MLLLAHSINFSRDLAIWRVGDRNGGAMAMAAENQLLATENRQAETEKLRRGRDGAYLLVTLKHMRTKLLYA